VISAFAEAPKGLITNARCLTESVDIPAAKMAAFIDHRQSRVNIVQAVGRAMSKPRGLTAKRAQKLDKIVLIWCARKP